MESTGIARLSIDGDVVKLVAATPWSGATRMYLINIAGFSRSTDDDMELWAAATPEFLSTLAALVDFLSRRGVATEVDGALSQKLEARSRLGASLDEARRRGAEIHQDPPVDIPGVPGFIRTLTDYQGPAVAHLLGVKHAANFSVPGSGKTTVVLAAFAFLRSKNEINKLIVIGPRSCFAPWEEEFESCFGRKPNSLRLSGTPTDRYELYKLALNPSVDLVLVTYATAANDSIHLARLLEGSNAMLVLDESHYVKRLNGGVWATTVQALAPFAAKRVVLSGTPVPNGILDIWSQMTFLWPDPPVLGSREQFRDRVQRAGDGIEDQVRDEILPLFWRVKKSDVDLPVPTYHRVPVRMGPYQEAIYKVIGAKVLSDVVSQPSEREKLRRWRTAKMIRLLQTASNPTLLSERSLEFKLPPMSAAGLSVSEIISNYSEFEQPTKLLAARDLVRELIGRGQKVVLWSVFVHNLNVLAAMLPEFNPRVVHGLIPKDASEDSDSNRELLIRQFKTDDDYPLLIANPGACAESISLHKTCKHAVYVDRTFNGAQYMQSLDRIHRLGLRKTDEVHYYLLSSIGSVDELIDSRLEEKQEKLRMLLEGDLATVDLDDQAVSEESEEANDFALLVAHLKQKFGPVSRDD